MGSIIKSVSLDFIEDDFLKDYKLSPTQLLKEKIWEMRGMMKKLAEDKIRNMANIIQEQAIHIENLENALEKEKQGDKER